MLQGVRARVVPDALKVAVVGLLLKKPSLLIQTNKDSQIIGESSEGWGVLGLYGLSRPILICAKGWLWDQICLGSPDG